MMLRALLSFVISADKCSSFHPAPSWYFNALSLVGFFGAKYKQTPYLNLSNLLWWKYSASFLMSVPWAVFTCRGSIWILQWDENEMGRCCACWWLLLVQGRSPVLVTQDVLWHPWQPFGSSLLQSGAGSWGQAPFENRQCLCCCTKAQHVLGSQRATCSCRACCLSPVQNVCAKRFFWVPSSKSNIHSTPFPHYLRNCFFLVNLHHSAQVALDSVRVCKCRALWGSAWFLTSFPSRKCSEWVTAFPSASLLSLWENR